MITDRKLGSAELLYNCAVRMNLKPIWIMQDSIFSISTELGERLVYDAKSTINSQISSDLARNKLATRVILEYGGLPSIAYLNPKNLAEAEHFLAQHAKIIVKPLSGSNSHDVHIVDAPEQLRDMDLSEYILEKYVAGRELRYMVLNDKIIAVHESEYGQSVSETRELKRISYPESMWDTGLITLALKTAKLLGLRYAAVDYLIGPQGQTHILEVNGSPGMKWLHAPTSGPAVDVARLFLEAMLYEMRSEAPLTPVSLASSPVKAYS